MWRRPEQVRLRQRSKRKRHQLPNAAEDDLANNHRSQLNPQLPGGQEEGREAVKIKVSGSQPNFWMQVEPPRERRPRGRPRKWPQKTIHQEEEQTAHPADQGAESTEDPPTQTPPAALPSQESD
ncbi:high mobility group AT-hook 2b isoform X1 [Chanodichthys erythropterus]|uniref:high mobility group AT-hook 2b isoform X1 n=1 Tax=Chanodichthys erythropterus TaxID=933992 RepID=UPI00351DD19A